MDEEIDEAILKEDRNVKIKWRRIKNGYGCSSNKEFFE